VPNRVKLCAIAKNEGAYLADWVFHHLHFGFDALEVWINGTDDTSVEIMESVCSEYPQVSFRVADKLLRDSLAKRRYFQYRAYARMAKGAARQGFSHVAFLDLDEYWTPRDLATSIGAFVAEDDDINVVSFQWCWDTPDLDREPFAPVVRDSVMLQLDRHVKSVIRLDDRIVQFRTHTARTSAGRRMLLDSPFPMVDERGQQWGSVVPQEYLEQHWDVLPKAFVLHAVHRSQIEYVASLAKGLRQTGADLDLKTNRRGYALNGAPQLEFVPVSEALAAYSRERDRFHSRIRAGSLIRESERLTVERADALLSSAAEDESVMARLRGPLHQVAAPLLDSRYPGWDSRVEWRFGVESVDGRLWITGWAFGSRGEEIELAIRDGSGKEWADLLRESIARPGVARSHPDAPLMCGFRIAVPPALTEDLRNATLMARVSGSEQFWDVKSLAGRGAAPTGSG
jgi:hypothetical protein